MNLLITGGAGFIGSNLIHYLIDQPDIAKLVNLDALTYAGHLENLDGVHGCHPKYIFEQVDLRDSEAVTAAVQRHDITHVMHLAAESHVDRSITGAAIFMQTNVMGTLHLLEACRRHWRGREGCRFLHVSTDEVYGSLQPEDPAFDEATPYDPHSPYSASKAASDHLASAWFHTHGLPVVVTNCSNNYGPYQFPEKLIPVVILRALNEEPIPIYGAGENIRDWLHVEDHCSALVTVLKHGIAGETYCIGGNNERRNIDLVRDICGIVDEERGLLRPDSGRKEPSASLIRFVQDRPGHDFRYAIASNKIQRDLGWSPRRQGDEGLRETVRWYLENPAWISAVTGKQGA